MSGDRLPIETHRAVEYRLVDHGLQDGGFTVTRAADGARYDIIGVCPGCGARVVRQWTFGPPGAKSRRDERRMPKPGPRTLTCDCGSVHADRPPENYDKGCGAFWQVMLP
ncbi:hypothetical protein E1293_13380 [Actinomadura darangshiensis]|uniref:Uncharacterized protein n=1 Tax=Actinomadura darangshiensis TaxID=705336 RepID=A0A4R5BGZ9_9ACTN|nr:hypothetical protein [Actinomadura darangshiensis]TDD84160.1 hypothetical protein E1293_13380 [Actinomadura darangshiensis]